MRLQCSVPVPCPDLPPSITWLPRQGFISEQRRLHQVTSDNNLSFICVAVFYFLAVCVSLINQNEDELLTLTSTLTFIASANHHNRNITCSASYPLLNGSTLGPSASTQVLGVLCKTQLKHF